MAIVVDIGHWFTMGHIWLAMIYMALIFIADHGKNMKTSVDRTKQNKSYWPSCFCLDCALIHDIDIVGLWGDKDHGDWAKWIAGLTGCDKH